MSGRSSQRKGADGERELSAKLSEYGYDTKRGGSLSFGDQPDLYGLPGVHIEVKRVERLNVPAAMQQAVHDAARFGDGIPALFHRRNRQPWLVTLRLDDFMALYENGLCNRSTNEARENALLTVDEVSMNPSSEAWVKYGRTGEEAARNDQPTYHSKAARKPQKSVGR